MPPPMLLSLGDDTEEAFGLAGEWGYLSWKTSVFVGSLCLVASFTLLGTYVDDSDPFSVAFYWSMYVVWGLYGVAFLFPYLYKNISYNRKY